MTSLQPLNTNDELTYIINYLSHNWEGIDFSYDNFFEFIWKESLEKNKYFFNTNFFIEAIEKYKFNSYGTPNLLHLDISLATFSLYNYLSSNQDYENNIKNIISSYQHYNDDEFKRVNKLKPLGWRELEKDYTDFKGIDDFNINVENSKFNGFKDNFSKSLSFVRKVSLPHVMYDDKCQGRNALMSLVSGIYTQAYDIISYNNTLTMIKELEPIFKDESILINEIFFNEPLNQALSTFFILNKNKTSHLDINSIFNTSHVKNRLLLK